MAIGVLTSTDLKPIWTVKIPLRMAIFLWIFKQKKVPTLDNLQRRGYSFANRCFLCCKDNESCKHLVAECDYTRKIWSLLRNTINTAIDLPHSTSLMLQALYTEGGSQLSRQIQGVFVFCMWRERCRRALSAQTKIERLLLDEIEEEISTLRKMVERGRIVGGGVGRQNWLGDLGRCKFKPTNIYPPYYITYSFSNNYINEY
ncbi:hypothetical protein LUZ60_012112 [Juncus effusus]|nr:hypothetical protein LUZ60_012112 [Juncus effusus]